MADTKALGRVGFALGGITALAMLAALFTVNSHIQGGSSFDAPRAVMAGLAASR